MDRRGKSIGSARAGFRAFIALLLLPAASPSLLYAQNGVGEYELKAAFLYNFAKFVEWPPSDLAESFRICVLGADPFGETLDRTVEGKRVRNRPLEVRRLERRAGGADCQILFISPSEERRVPDVLSEVARESVLTVGETEGFAERGGMVNFRLSGNRIRLDINADAAKRAGLRMSSQLLKLARIVHDHEEPER